MDSSLRKKKMLNRRVFEKALKNTWISDKYPGWNPDNPPDGQSSMISLLVYDIFGGEILKTHIKNGWHFYNRIDGERIDLIPETSKSSSIDSFDDIPSTSDETSNYFEPEDYSSFYMKFVMAIEEVAGLRKYQTNSTN